MSVASLLGASPTDPHRGSDPEPRWGTSVLQTLFRIPFLEFLDPPLGRDEAYGKEKK